MSVAGAVMASVLVGWALGLVAGAAWTQSWGLVRRGHFRICAWSALLLCALAALAVRDGSASWLVAVAVGSACVLLYLGLQYVAGDRPGSVSGVVAIVAGVGLAIAYSSSVAIVGGLQLIAGGAMMGAVTNGMLLGHWYLNQPGLKTSALGRLTSAGLVTVALTLAMGLIDIARLSDAPTEGAVLGLPGFGESFGPFFFVIWVVLVVATGGVVLMARRCVNIRSIQSATGLYYVALLTAGVSEFLIRYLLVNAA